MQKNPLKLSSFMKPNFSPSFNHKNYQIFQEGENFHLSRQKKSKFTKILERRNSGDISISSELIKNLTLSKWISHQFLLLYAANSFKKYILYKMSLFDTHLDLCFDNFDNVFSMKSFVICARHFHYVCIDYMQLCITCFRVQFFFTWLKVFHCHVWSI